MDSFTLPSICHAIAVQNYGCSGTLFIQSLLDGHPNMLALPALHAHQLYYFWEAHQREDIDTFVDNFIKTHTYWFDEQHKLCQLYSLPAQTCVDVYRFATVFKNFLHHNVLSRKNFIVSAYCAYYCAAGFSYIGKTHLVFPIHSLSKNYAKMLVADFADVKFLHMIRHPVAVIGSLAKHINSNPDLGCFSLLQCSVSQALLERTRHIGWKPVKSNGFKPFLKNNKKNAEQTRGLKLEELHRQPQETLSKLVKWLNVPWSDHLLQSTFMEYPWGNRKESINVSGFDVKVVQQTYEDYLSHFDHLRLHYLSLAQQKAANYHEQLTLRDRFYHFIQLFLIFFPFKMEKIPIRKKAFEDSLLENQSYINVAYPYTVILRLLKIYPIGIKKLIPIMRIQNYIVARIIFLRIWIKFFAFRKNFVQIL